MAHKAVIVVVVAVVATVVGVIVVVAADVAKVVGVIVVVVVILVVTVVTGVVAVGVWRAAIASVLAKARMKKAFSPSAQTWNMPNINLRPRPVISRNSTRGNDPIESR